MPEGGHLLEVEDLAVEFDTAHGAVKAVRGISFHVDKGETLAILGESGSGKSVSASAIMDLIDSPPGFITGGRIHFKGRDLRGMSDAERREINGRQIAMIFQDPLAHLNPVYDVGWQVAETLTVHGQSGRDARGRALELMQRVGIPDAERRFHDYPHQFSGGQRQRVMIAMALGLKPDILIADEPTTALDVTVQAQILALLEELQKETGMGLLLITHDLGVVAEVADRVAVMHDGLIVETGPARDVFRAPSHPYTRKLMGAVPGRGTLPEPQPEAAAPPLLQVVGLTKHYEITRGLFRRSTGQAVRALEDASFVLRAGEVLGIVGESGSGKSTLARTLLRLEEPTAGKALFHGSDLFALSPRDLFLMRRKIQIVFQDPTSSLNPRMSIEQLIGEAWAIHPDLLPRGRRRQRTAELLELVGLLPDHMRRFAHQLSGGQRQRVAIARALALEPEIVICDEAVSALDVSIQAQVIELLKRLQGELDLSYLFIAHDLPVVRDFADRVLVMHQGRIVEEGTTRDIFTAPRHSYTQALLAASPEPDPDLQAERRRQREQVLA